MMTKKLKKKKDINDNSLHEENILLKKQEEAIYI